MAFSKMLLFVTLEKECQIVLFGKMPQYILKHMNPLEIKVTKNITEQKVRRDELERICPVSKSSVLYTTSKFATATLKALKRKW